ncbi:MAG: CBS domain-containing protein [Rhodoferax sp.]|nr:CBS domain-containing protein [Rhodoferax sp.]
MFSVFGKGGRIFQGSMEDLRQVPSIGAAARTRAILPIGKDAHDSFSNNLQSAAGHSLPLDTAHRSAVLAYEQTSKPAERRPLTVVSDVMTRNVITLPDSATVEQAWELLAQKGIGQAPVVDENHMLIGLLSRADLTRPDRLPAPDSHALVWRALLAQSVTDMMWSPVPSVAADTDIRRVARVLLDTGLPGLPVVDDAGMVQGFVSRSDILRAVVADPPLDLWT